MARQRMVTRTIEMTTVQYTFVNLETKVVELDMVNFNSLKKGISEAELLQKIRETCEPGIIPVAIENMDTMDVIYGMTEDEFLRGAQIIER